MLAETATTEISKTDKPNTFPRNRRVAKRGGGVARVAREKIESETGKNLICGKNFIPKKLRNK